MILFGTKNLLKVILFSAFFSVIAANAQSTNSDFPTPVTANEIKGKVAVRDIGDSRSTRYFYTFTGTPGDLNITIESENLNGDVDIFTVNGLRPLTKISLFDYGFKIVTSGSIYLRKREPLLLRIEAKSKGETAGTFRVQFSGGFEAIADAGNKQSEEPTIAKTKTSEGTVRVNSAGARIEEPKPPVKEKPAPKTETASTSTNNTGTAKTKPGTTLKSSTPAPNTTSTTKKPANTPPAGTSTTTTTTRETPAARRRRLAEERAEAERKRKEEAAAERKNKQEADKAANDESKNDAIAKNNANKANKKPETINNTKPSAPKVKEPAPDPMASIFLVVETKDGGRIERRMNEVRRVNVEKGFLVVIFMDGKTEKIPMINVQKMSIEPQ